MVQKRICEKHDRIGSTRNPGRGDPDVPLGPQLDRVTFYIIIIYFHIKNCEKSNESIRLCKKVGGSGKNRFFGVGNFVRFSNILFEKLIEFYVNIFI